MSFGFEPSRVEGRPLPCPLCRDPLMLVSNSELTWWGHTREERCPLGHVQMWTGEQVKQWNDRIRREANFGKTQPGASEL